jgi:hypothetical protein
MDLSCNICYERFDELPKEHFLQCPRPCTFKWCYYCDKQLLSNKCPNCRSNIPSTRISRILNHLNINFIVGCNLLLVFKCMPKLPDNDSNTKYLIYFQRFAIGEILMLNFIAIIYLIYRLLRMRIAK